MNRRLRTREENTQDLTSYYEREREVRRPRIAARDILALLNPNLSRDGLYFVIRWNGYEVRNLDRQAALRDFATIAGYKVNDG